MVLFGSQADVFHKVFPTKILYIFIHCRSILATPTAQNVLLHSIIQKILCDLLSENDLGPSLSKCRLKFNSFLIKQASGL